MGITFRVFKENAKPLLKVEPTLQNLKNLTKDQAKTIYKTKCWDKTDGDEIKDKNVADLYIDTQRLMVVVKR